VGFVAEVVREIGEGAFGDVGGRNEDQRRDAQRPIESRQEVGPRRRGRLLEGEGSAVPAQAVDQAGQRATGTRERANERRG